MKKSNWILIAVIAAVVAALTTVVVFVLRARAKSKAWYDQEPIDCDVDEECFEFDDEDVVVADSETAE